LIRALNAELSARYPEEGANHFRLDPQEVEPGRGAFFIAYVGAEAVGCGAVRLIDRSTAEIKRMYIEPQTRRFGLGGRMLAVLETEARRLGAARLVLETGDRYPDALNLYLEAGFVRVPAFGEYVGSPLSVCMAKDIQG
jgi:GNAT superfamily N-acetyltransferase